MDLAPRVDSSVRKLQWPPRAGTSATTGRRKHRCGQTPTEALARAPGSGRRNFLGRGSTHPRLQELERRLVEHHFGGADG
jgi:hypothetical protein